MYVSNTLPLPSRAALLGLDQNRNFEKHGLGPLGKKNWKLVVEIFRAKDHIFDV
jgi:hypothetical protein